MQKQKESESTDKRYNKIKIRLTIFDMVLSLLFFAVLAFSGLSKTLVDTIRNSSTLMHNSEYPVYFVFIFLIGAVLALIGAPFDFYGGYIIEKRFNLSNQTVRKWAIEKLKGVLVSFLIGVPLAGVFFFLLRNSGPFWWFYFSLFLFFVTVFLTRITPVLIFPLFYKFKELDNVEIKEKINALMEKYSIKFKDIYTFNLSKDTRKANAAFAGAGSTRRIILSDTLVADFTPDEIEVVFAHELGHYKKRHLVKNIIISTLAIFLSFFMCGTFYSVSLHYFNYTGIADIAAIPLLVLYLSLFSLLLMPVMNAVSRMYEREADAFALEITGNRNAFVSSMEKLASINLADKEPHPVVEFLLYSHPSITKRIEFANSYNAKG